MNDNAKAWVAALRSGKYKQAKGRLKTDTGHCCLGVACEQFRESTGSGEWLTVGSGVWPSFSDGGDASNTHLTRSVQQWLGLASDCGAIAGDCPLTDRNDSGYPFAAIADIIESEPEGLFT